MPQSEFSHHISQTVETMKGIIVFFAVLALAQAGPKAIKPYSLSDDLNDILSVIPVEEIISICEHHLANDGATVTVVLYLQGEEWAQLVDTLRSKFEVQELIQYLTDAGLPIYEWIDAIHVAIMSAVPGTYPDENGSLRSLLDEVESVIPVRELISIIVDKLQSSADLQQLYLKISTGEVHRLVEEVRGIEEVQRLEQRLTDMGVRVEEALEFIYYFLGWESP